MKRLLFTCCTLVAGALAASTLPLLSQQVQTASIDQPIPLGGTDRPQASAPLPGSASPGWNARQGEYYKRKWGINIVDVRRVASGEMLAFRYVIVEPEKAKSLNDKRNTAYLIDEKSGRKLMVPQLENVGALRTTVAPAAGRMYWMIFANTGRFVEVGSLVDVVIGDFHATGLTVDAK